jgi:hypothetical protein
LLLINHRISDKHLPDGIEIEKPLKLDFQNLYQKKYQKFDSLNSPYKSMENKKASAETEALNYCQNRQLFNH